MSIPASKRWQVIQHVIVESLNSGRDDSDGEKEKPCNALSKLEKDALRKQCVRCGWLSVQEPVDGVQPQKGNCYEAAKTSHLWNNMDVSTDSRWNLCMFVTWKSLVVSAWQMVNRNPLVTASKADGCRQRLRHPSTTIKVSPSHLPLTCSKIVPVMIPVRSVLPTINFYCYVS